ARVAVRVLLLPRLTGVTPILRAVPLRAVTLLVVAPALGIRLTTGRLAAVGLPVRTPAFPTLAVVSLRVLPLWVVPLPVVPVRVVGLAAPAAAGRRPASVAAPGAWHTLLPGLALITFRIMGPSRAGASGHRSRHTVYLPRSSSRSEATHLR